MPVLRPESVAERQGPHSERLGARQGSSAPTPWLLVSVAFKGLSYTISLLFATLAGRLVNVAAKGLTGTYCWRESNWLGWEDFGGVRRTTWRAHIKGEAPSSPAGPESTIPTGSESANAKAAAGRWGKRAEYIDNYYILVSLVKDYFKWFEWERKQVFDDSGWRGGEQESETGSRGKCRNGQNEKIGEESRAPIFRALVVSSKACVTRAGMLLVCAAACEEPKIRKQPKRNARRDRLDF
jgi:hypothetical protein